MKLTRRKYIPKEELKKAQYVVQIKLNSEQKLIHNNLVEFLQKKQEKLIQDRDNFKFFEQKQIKNYQGTKEKVQNSYQPYYKGITYDDLETLQYQITQSNDFSKIEELFERYNLQERLQ